VGWLLPLNEASLAQEAAGKQPGVYALWQQARDCFRRGDYETAAVHYQQVKANQQQLSPGEQADLREMIAQNNVAVQGLRAGRTQLTRAEEAIADGRPIEARGLLRTVMTNQFLSPDDRQKLNVLNERLRGMSAPNAVRASRDPMQGTQVAQNTAEPVQPAPMPGKAPAPAPKADPRTLLNAARSALTKGDLNAAERLATDAKRAGSPGLSAWLVPWSDTPDKVLREVGVARARLAAQSGNGMDKSSKPPARPAWSPSGFARTTTPPERQVIQAQAKVPPQVPEPSPTPGGSRFAPAFVTTGDQPKFISTHVSVGEQPSVKPTAQPGAVAQMTSPPALPTNTVVPPPPGPLPVIDPPPLPTKNEVAIVPPPPLPKKNDVPLVQPTLQASNDVSPLPRKNDVPFVQPPPVPVQRADVPAPLPAPDQPIKVTENPRQQLKQARAAFKEGRIDDAEVLLNVVQSARVRWGLFEDTPQRLREDMAARLLADARKAFVKKNYEEARSKAFHSQNLHGPYSVWTLGDRPQYLLNEIARAENAKGRQLPPMANPAPTATAKVEPGKGATGNPAIAQGPLTPPKMVNEKPPQAVAQAPLVPPVMPNVKAPPADASRERALALLNESRSLWKQGKLVEARDKATQAKKTNAAFSRDEESPDVVLLQLAAACSLRVQAMVRHAEEGLGQSADPTRYDRAQAELKQARDLAKAFGQDTVRIDQKCEMLALEATLSTRPPGVPNTGNPGQAVAQIAHKQIEAPIATPSKGQTIIIPQGPAEPKKNSGQTVVIPQGPPEPVKGVGEKVVLPPPPVDPPRPPQVARVTPPSVQPTGSGEIVVQPPPVNPPRPPQVTRVTPPAVLVPQETPQQHGLNLLDQSRRELRAGQSKMARTLAVEAFNPKYGVQNEAAAVLRSIDAEEFNQKMLAANRAADAVFAAYYRRDFGQARAILAGVDARMLSPDRQGRLKEIMQTTDMNPPSAQAIAQVGGFGGPTPQIGEAPGKVTVGDDGGDFASNFRAMEEVKFQQLREECRKTQDDAMKRFRNGEAEVALDMLSDYLNRLSDVQLAPDRLVLLRRPVADRLQKLRTLAERNRLADAQLNQLQATGHNRERQRLKAEQERHEKVAELLKQANELYRDGKYQETIMLAQKARDIDPGNYAIDAVEKVATMHMNLENAKRASRSKEKLVLDGLGDAEDQGPFLNMRKPLDFGDKEYQKRVRGRQDRSVTMINRFTPKQLEIENKLLTPVSPSCHNTPLDQAIHDLQELSGVNLIIDKYAVDVDGINLKLPVSLSLTEPMSLKSVLATLLRPARLTYVVNKDHVLITTEENTTGKLVTKTYSVADLVIPVENFQLPDNANIYKVLEKHDQSTDLQNNMPTPWTPTLGLNQGQSIGTYNGSHAGFGAAGIGPGPGAGGTLPGNAPVPATQKGAGRTIEDLLVKLIQSTIHPQSWSDMGGQGTIQYYPLGMALVVNQTPNIQEEIADLLVALRRLQDLEVAIEMRIIGLSEEFYEYMGVNFDVNIRNRNTSFQPQLTTQQFTPPGQINFPAPTGVVSGLTPAGTLTRDLGIPLNNSSFDFAIPPFGGFPGTLGADGGLALGLAFLSDIQVFLFMEAAQGDTRTNLMQAPKLTMFNGQTATITVTDFQFLLTSIRPINVGSLLFFAPVNTPIPLGIAMTVQPVVSADRRFVRISLVPTVTSIAPNIGLFPIQTPIQSVFPVGAAGTTSGQLENVFQVFLQQPNLTAISVTTTVTVPDGGTVLLGGVKTLVEARNEFGPPILSQIPYLSRLFRNTSYGRETRTLMIMVTPRIIINEEEEEQQVGTPEIAIPRQ
jgi:type II secretory pathway component GspD/PulD (secretin)